ncbi:MAG: hypothetical protein J3Q66DRAFT_411651 [Benniella sp.]|nr:MAG: hypothetical protein J3Q66DRAFT_411651 [Benniella sp.]
MDTVGANHPRLRTWVIPTITSVLAGVVLILLRYSLQDTPEYVGPINETSFDSTLAPEKCISIPGLDRLVCALVQHIVDSSKTDYGQSVVRDLTAFMGPLMFLLTVEASRVGNSGSLLACMPFTAIVTCFFGGGTYLLFFFVPLMNYARKRIQKTGNSSHPPPSDIPLARVYAILVANALHMASILYMLTLGPTQEGEAHSQALQRVIENAVLMVSLWFIYSPLTWLFGRWMDSQGKEIKARQLVRNSFLFMAAVSVVLQMWAFYRDGSTPLRHIYNFSFRPPPFQHKEYAPAFSLMWDLVGAIGASWLWVRSEVNHLAFQGFFMLISVLFPGAALMLYAACRELMLVNYAQSLSAKRVQ